MLPLRHPFYVPQRLWLARSVAVRAVWNELAASENLDAAT
jgi:hypothetical protein